MMLIQVTDYISTVIVIVIYVVFDPFFRGAFSRFHFHDKGEASVQFSLAFYFCSNIIFWIFYTKTIAMTIVLLVIGYSPRDYISPSQRV